MHQVLHGSGCVGKLAVPMVVRDIGNKQVKESLYLPVNVLRIKRRKVSSWHGNQLIFSTDLGLLPHG